MKYSESLKKTKDFQNVYRRGKSYANRYLVMYVLSNQTEGNRLGISVSKKVGNSVVRHRVTRLIRESIRLNVEKFENGYDIVIIARNTAKCRKCTKFIKIVIHNYSIASGTRQEAGKWVIPSAGRRKANCLAKCCFCEKMTAKSDKLCRKMMVMKNIFWTREKKGDIIYPIMEQCFRCSGSIKMR